MMYIVTFEFQNQESPRMLVAAETPQQAAKSAREAYPNDANAADSIHTKPLENPVWHLGPYDRVRS